MVLLVKNAQADYLSPATGYTLPTAARSLRIAGRRHAGSLSFVSGIHLQSLDGCLTNISPRGCQPRQTDLVVRETCRDAPGTMYQYGVHTDHQFAAHTLLIPHSPTVKIRTLLLPGCTLTCVSCACSPWYGRGRRGLPRGMRSHLTLACPLLSSLCSILESPECGLVDCSMACQTRQRDQCCIKCSTNLLETQHAGQTGCPRHTTARPLQDAQTRHLSLHRQTRPVVHSIMSMGSDHLPTATCLFAGQQQAAPLWPFSPAGILASSGSSSVWTNKTAQM